MELFVETRDIARDNDLVRHKTRGSGRLGLNAVCSLLNSLFGDVYPLIKEKNKLYLLVSTLQKVLPQAEGLCFLTSRGKKECRCFRWIFSYLQNVPVDYEHGEE